MYNNGNSSKNVTGASVVDGTIANADIDSSAAIATSKLSGAVTSIASHGLASSATTDTTNASNIGSGTLSNDRLSLDISNSDVNASAEIAQSKLATLVITDSEVADNALSGNKIDGGTISNFASTGIDDNATSTAVTLDSSGDVMIGSTVAPIGTGLTVNSGISSSSITAIEIQQNTTGAVKAAAAFGVGIANGGESTNAASLKMLTATGGSLVERMRITSSGDVQVKTGNLVIGTAGKGIDFSATANTTASGASMTSELLDDYEEGTWTPAFTTTGTALDSVTHSHQSGSYTKIGRKVTVTFMLRTSAVTVGSASGYLIIEGLPFTPSHSGSDRGGGSAHSTFGWGGEAPRSLSISGSTNNIYPTYHTTNNRTYNSDPTDLSASGNNDVYGAATYFTA